MAVTDGDLIITYSGGGTNIDPDSSLGGNPSVQPIFSNKLFDDVSEEEALSGVTDYRCFYLHNENALDTLYDVEVSVLYTVAGDVTVELGFDFVNERQNLTVTNATLVTGGAFTLGYQDLYTSYSVVVSWNSSLATWASNLQTALRTINNLETVTVSSSYSGTSVIFEIDFTGNSGKRFHEMITLIANNLVCPSPVTVSIVRTVEGSPFNNVADEIDVETTNPNNVVFSTEPVIVGDLRPLDLIPVWVKRTVPANTIALEGDGFTFKVKGSAVL